MTKKIIKIVFYNTLVLVFLLSIVEAIFGGWFKKNNLGPYFREHRMKKVSYSIKYNENPEKK